MNLHVRVWHGSGTARVTDMTNAGKRGKKCRTLRLSGAPSNWNHSPANESQQQAAQATLDICVYLEGLPGSAESRNHEPTFDNVREQVLVVVNAARALGVMECYLAVYDEEIRGVDAPRPKLTAGVEGLWSAGADESGISLHDLNDPYNEWTEITPSNQTGPAAYAIAAKVWDRVKGAKTRGEASAILRNAGAKLHGYCAID